MQNLNEPILEHKFDVPYPFTPDMNNPDMILHENFTDFYAMTPLNADIDVNAHATSATAANAKPIVWYVAKNKETGVETAPIKVEFSYVKWARVKLCMYFTSTQMRLRLYTYTTTGVESIATQSNTTYLGQNYTYRIIAIGSNLETVSNYMEVKPEIYPVVYNYKTTRNIAASVTSSFKTKRAIAGRVLTIAKTKRSITAQVRAVRGTYKVYSGTGIKMNYEEVLKRRFLSYEKNTYEEIERGDIDDILLREQDLFSTSTFTAEEEVKLKEDLVVEFNVVAGFNAIQNVATNPVCDIVCNSIFSAEAKTSHIFMAEANIVCNSTFNGVASKFNPINLDVNFVCASNLDLYATVINAVSVEFKTSTIIDIIPMSITTSNAKAMQLEMQSEYDITVELLGDIETLYYNIERYDGIPYWLLYKTWANLSFEKGFVINKEVTITDDYERRSDIYV